MSRVNTIEDILEPAIKAMGFELVACELSQHRHGGVLRVFVDGQNGITLDDCAAISRQISVVLDVEDPIAGRYNLEVSSPGLDRPLTRLEHYMRYIGRRAKLRFRIPRDGQRNFAGIIVAVKDSVILLELEKSKLEVPFSDIEKANLIADFNQP